MNNGVNETNNLNNQNTTLEPVLQPIPAPVTPEAVPAAPVVNQAVMQPVVQTVQQPVMAPVVETVAPTPVVASVAVEDEAVVQNIPGVIVAPPQHGGMDKPNPIAPLPGTEVVEEKEEVEEKVEEAPAVVVDDTPKKKKKNILARFFFLIILVMGGVIGYLWYTHQLEIAKLNYECTPVSTTGDVKRLELDSTIVLDLYSKVKTSLKEDLAEIELTDQLRYYLAFRQIPQTKFYSSNCNLFSNTAMEPYVCTETVTTSPLAFKEEDLKLELKKLFGDKYEVPLMNVQLSNSCIGGYQYIAERGEYVQGDCTNKAATTFKMDKKLVKAESKEAYIMLYEEVKYYNAEGIDLPEKMKSGTYVYTFKLDMNYNYTYVSKVLQEK